MPVFEPVFRKYQNQRIVDLKFPAPQRKADLPLVQVKIVQVVGQVFLALGSCSRGPMQVFQKGLKLNSSLRLKGRFSSVSRHTALCKIIDQGDQYKSSEKTENPRT